MITTWNREAAILRRIFSIAVQQGWVIKNPFNCGDPLIRPSAERRRERILTLDEETRLLDACQSHPSRRRIDPLLIFLIDSGCRKSEALKLRWKNVSFVSRIVTIEAMTTKTLRSRQIIMTDRVFVELSSLRERSDTSDDLVFGISDNVRKSFASRLQTSRH